VKRVRELNPTAKVFGIRCSAYNQHEAMWIGRVSDGWNAYKFEQL
jgi:hypothetical protein